MTMNLREFKLWMSSLEGSEFSITKLKSTNSAWSGISEGEAFVGKLVVVAAGERDLILFMSQPYMHTSSLRDAQKKNDSTWLVKTLNSIYKVKLRKQNA